MFIIKKSSSTHPFDLLKWGHERWEVNIWANKLGCQVDVHGAIMGMNLITNTKKYYHDEHHFNNIQKYEIQCGHKFGVH
jgi:hypothetical protein